MKYNPQAVDNAIAQANRRTPISSRERKMIHAILKGSDGYVRNNQRAGDKAR